MPSCKRCGCKLFDIAAQHNLQKANEDMLNVLQTAYDIAVEHDDRFPFDWAVFCEMLWQAIERNKAK